MWISTLKQARGLVSFVSAEQSNRNSDQLLVGIFYVYSEDIFLSAKRYSENMIILHEKLFNQNERDEYRYILVEKLNFLTVE